MGSLEPDGRIEFCIDAGAARTIVRPSDVKGRKIRTTESTGRNFRAANGNLIPNMGAVRLRGKANNDEKLAITAQVADVSKPLASAIEMVQSDNVIIMDKEGGMIKYLDGDKRKELMDTLKSMH